MRAARHDSDENVFCTNKLSTAHTIKKADTMILQNIQWKIHTTKTTPQF